MPIARRKFITMMASVPLCTRFATIDFDRPAAESATNKFYVWIHGIFGITLQSSQILLISPRLVDKSNKHIYKIGRVTDYRKEKREFIGVQDLSEPGTYQIDGLGEAVRPMAAFLDKREFFSTTGKAIPDLKETFYFSMKYPKLIRPLRPAKAKIIPPNSQTKFTLKPNDGPLPQGGLIPLTHVFEYEVPPSQVLIRKGIGGPRVFAGLPDSQHLHIYAEPDPWCEKCHDDKATLKALLNCYQNLPEFELKNDQADCPLLNNILSFTGKLNEQFGLFEWTGQCRETPHLPMPMRPQATRRPADCPHLVVRE